MAQQYQYDLVIVGRELRVSVTSEFEPNVGDMLMIVNATGAKPIAARVISRIHDFTENTFYVMCEEIAHAFNMDTDDDGVID